MLKQKKKISRVATALELEPWVAQILCKYFEWNVDKVPFVAAFCCLSSAVSSPLRAQLLDAYLKDPTGVLTKAGVLNPQLKHAIPVTSPACLICDEGPGAVKIQRYLDCKHPVARESKLPAYLRLTCAAVCRLLAPVLGGEGQLGRHQEHPLPGLPLHGRRPRGSHPPAAGRRSEGQVPEVVAQSVHRPRPQHPLVHPPRLQLGHTLHQRRGQRRPLRVRHQLLLRLRR